MDITQHQPSAADFCATRRQFLNRFGMGFGALSLASLLGNSLGGSAQAAPNLSPLAPKAPPFPGKAKRVIHIFSQGGPSHIDTWDPKPEMAKHVGEDIKLIGGVPLPTQFSFKKMGQCGTEVSEIFPHIGESIDDIAVIRSMTTDIPAHEFATLMMNTGSGRLVKPSMGSWVLYGLGAENQNLPGFIALGGGARRRDELALGVPARRISGHARGKCERAGGEDHREHQEPLRHAPAAAPAARPAQADERNARRAAPPRAGARGAHPVLRTRLQDADGSDRRFRRERRSRRISATCTATATSAAGCSSRAASWKMACASCRCGRAGGIITRT